MASPSPATKQKVGERLFGWLDERLSIRELTTWMSHKVVPLHGHSIFYYLGGLTLFLFLVQIGTGILLLMYYRPGADSAYESVKFIVSDVSFGWLIRSIHSWSANLMIFTAFLHMFTVFFTQAYRPPREMTWYTGGALLALALTFGFSGYLLPWNELSFFATRVGTGMMKAIPFVGGYLSTVLRGGEEVTGATIGRFFGLHVAILPALFSLVLGGHLLLVQRQGMSEPIEWKHTPDTQKKFMKFFPNFLYRDLLLWLVALNVLALLAVLFPDGIGVIHWPLGAKADPFGAPPDVIRPEWYFMFAFQALKLLPAKVLFLEGEQVGLLVLSVGGLIWLLIPFLDRKSKRQERSPFWIGFGVLVVVFILTLTIMGYLVK
jgi:quinol-cytochrome oxidoreductase complex cytochrome b subunit